MRTCCGVDRRVGRLVVIAVLPSGRSGPTFGHEHPVGVGEGSCTGPLVTNSTLTTRSAMAAAASVVALQELA